MHLQLNLFEAIGIKLLLLYINLSFRLCVCVVQKKHRVHVSVGLARVAERHSVRDLCIFRGVLQSVSRQNKFI